MSDLASKTCVPCKGGVPAAVWARPENLAKQVPQRKVVERASPCRGFTFSDFRQALAFVNKWERSRRSRGITRIFAAWGKAEVTTWTHKIDGLTERLILAAKIDKI